MTTSVVLEVLLGLTSGFDVMETTLSAEIVVSCHLQTRAVFGDLVVKGLLGNTLNEMYQKAVGPTNQPWHRE